MSTPQFYSWDDDGSPARALSGNQQNRLKQILVPCLVTGYGSKQGAGWTLGHEHPNGFSLINSEGNVVNFVSDLPAQAPYPAISGNAIHIYAAESLTDTSKAIIDGANLCSGTYRKGIPELSGYPRHGLGYARELLISQIPTLHWTLVADDKTFILNCSSSGSGSGNVIYFAFILYVGGVLLDTPISGNFIALGGGNDGYNLSGSMHAFSEGYTALRDLSTGLAQQVVVGAQPYISSSNIIPAGNTTSLPSRINFQQPRVVSGGKFVGRLRGVVYDDVLRSLYGWEVGLKALGFTGTDFTDRGKTVKIGDYSYAFARSHSGNSFLTDNPEFW